MRNYTPAEICMLLLFASLGEERPLRARNYRVLMRTLEALGEADGEEVSEAELLRLGQTPQEAGAILRRLRREPELQAHLETLAAQNITVLTRISPEYPRRLRQVLGDAAPMLLYCAGDTGLFQTECVSLVGSRQMREPGRQFAEAVGRAAAEQGLTYVSGGAIGADTAGFEAAMACGGRAIVFLADSLCQRMGTMEEALAAGRVLLVSLQGPDRHFSISRAYSRNDLIHAMGRKVFVAQTTYGEGGTWQGVMENLRQGWSPVYVCPGEPEDPGTRGLLERGGRSATAEILRDLRAAETDME